MIVVLVFLLIVICSVYIVQLSIVLTNFFELEFDTKEEFLHNLIPFYFIKYAIDATKSAWSNLNSN